jgi:hypothetical protein
MDLALLNRGLDDTTVLVLQPCLRACRLGSANDRSLTRFLLPDRPLNGRIQRRVVDVGRQPDERFELGARSLIIAISGAPFGPAAHLLPHRRNRREPPPRNLSRVQLALTAHEPRRVGPHAEHQGCLLHVHDGFLSQR